MASPGFVPLVPLNHSCVPLDQTSHKEAEEIGTLGIISRLL